MNQSLSIHCLLYGIATLWVLPGCVAGEPHPSTKANSQTTRHKPPLTAEAASRPLTIDQAIRLALAHNPGLRASDARRDAAAGRAVQSRAWPNPELEISSDDIPTRRGGVSQAKNMAGINQVVPFPGKKKADGQIGAADAAAGQAEWKLSCAEVVRDVKIAYCQVQIAERSTAVASDLVRVAESAATAAAKRNVAGEVALQEQLRAEIELEETRAEQIDADREATVARQALALVLGLPGLSAAELTGAPDESVKLALVGIAPSSMLAGHPAMVAARARRDQAVATVRRAGLESRPDVTVGVAAGRDEAANENLMAFRLSVPLPLFDRNRGKQQEARAGVCEAEADIAATQQALLTAWRTAVARYHAAAQQVTAHRDRILPKSEQALTLVQTGFEAGKFDFIDLLDIQRTTAKARLSYQKKVFELNAARAELEAMAEAVPADHP